MVIDFHTHCYKPLLAKKALSLIPAGSPYGPYFDGTSQGLLDKMADAGIDYSVQLNIANTALSTRSVNDYAIELTETKKLIPFGSIHPDYRDPLSEIARLKEHGVKGLKFHPYYQKFDLADKSVYPLYELAAKNDMIMLFHGGHDLMIKGDNSNPQKLSQILSDFKGAKFVFAHLGGWELWNDAFEMLIGKDVYLDTSFAFLFLTDEQKRFVLDNHNGDRLLFGTDSPWTDSKKELADIRKTVHSTELLDKILYKNAQKLLGIVD